MADEPTPDDPQDPQPDPDAGAKQALSAERKARRDAERAAADLRAKLKELEDKDKSDSERLTEQVSTLTKERDNALLSEARLKAAVTKGLSEDQAKRVLGGARRISGDTPEDLEADASDYFETFGSDPGESSSVPGKPTEALRGGGDPTQEPEVDMRALVADIPRGI